VRVRTPRDFDALYRALGPKLWRAIYVYTAGQRDITDDVVAEAFARAIERSDTVLDAEPWLYRTAFRLASAQLRRRPKGRLVSDGAAEPVESGLGDLVEALRRLSPAQRAAIVLHYEADLPVSEVARRMGSTNGAVRVHLHVGRKRLRAILGSREVDDD
jgi:RNA polymerase sigma-70 factor (ECF subfamily)